MPDGIARGVGEGLVQLGKQIVADVVKTPAKIVGLDETLGLGGGKQQKGQKTKTQVQGKTGEGMDQIQQMKQQDEVEKQKKLSQARQLLQQFIKPQGQPEPSIREQLEMEEMEKRKKEIQEERIKAQQNLPPPSSKAKRGNLYGIKQKVHGSELGKNTKSQ
jgi:hypothetical protein